MGHCNPPASNQLHLEVVDACRGRSNFFGSPVVCVAAGGIYDGRGLAASLSLGAAGVWVAWQHWDALLGVLAIGDMMDT